MTTFIDGQTSVWLPGDHPARLQTNSLASPVTGLQLSLTTGVDDTMPEASITLDDRTVTVTVNSSQLVRITAVIPTHDAVTLWQPGSARDHARIPASWEEGETVSPLDGMAVGCLVGADDHSLVTYGAQTGEHPVVVRAGLIEETAELLVSFQTTEMSEADTLQVHIDLADRNFVQSVKAMTARLHGPRPLSAVEDERPVLCTWYFLHQAIDGDVLMDYAEPAARLGFGTLIVDDGWQTTDTMRGYGSAGDWTVSATKIADAARMVEHFLDNNIRTMWWIGTPFIGHRSKALSHLPIVADDPQMHAAVIDSRNETARQYLVERIVELVSSTGAHGVKIDFLERFTGPSVPEGIEAGALSLLDDLRSGLDAVVTGASIEFREPYIGPPSTRRATMLRVTDCPMSPIRNRIGIVDLRLATSGIAVHSDPIMWADSDSVERVAQHLITALFGVPQISVDLLTLSDAHSQVLAFWLGIINKYRTVLLHGDFQPERPDLNYPVVHSSAERITFTARYSPNVVRTPQHPWTRWLIANADSTTVVLESNAEAPFPVHITIRDATGATVSTYSCPNLPIRITVPTGGLAILDRL